MSLAKEIIQGLEPNYDRVIREGESFDDIDEYGFTPLIETVICGRLDVAETLLERGASVDVPDILKRTPLQWAVDQSAMPFVKLFLSKGANPNTYDSNALSPLVYPILREQQTLKHCLYQHGAVLDFALDFIYGKLLGHRFELKGVTEILTPERVFVELYYEGFILEFTLSVMNDALRRFMSSYSTRHLKHYWMSLRTILDSLMVAETLLTYQPKPSFSSEDRRVLEDLMQTPLLILPAASRGHAFSFIRLGQWWAKIDRGEHALKEGSVNIYEITRPHALTLDFLMTFLYQRHPRTYFHEDVHRLLGLVPRFKIPLTPQVSGNCSWANVQGIIPTAYTLLGLAASTEDPAAVVASAMDLYETWVSWDKDRALDTLIQRFYTVEASRKVTVASMLAAVVFQSCDAENPVEVARAERIFPILMLPEYRFLLDSYLEHYCVKRLTPLGNNLLKLMDDCGVDAGLAIGAIAHHLKDE